MSTRSITTIRSRWDGKGEWEDHTHVFRHHDGYLEGHGQWLFDFLDGVEIVNGWRGPKKPNQENGPGRLAARLVCALRADGHDPDLVPPGDCGQEFHYVIEVEFGMNGGEIAVAVLDGPMTFFGTGGDECTNEIFRGSWRNTGAFWPRKDEHD